MKPAPATPSRVPNGAPRPAATQPDSRPPHLTRLWSVVALITINIIVGIWFRLNRPDGIPQFSLGSLIVGIPTVLGLLPADEKAGWMRNVTSRVHALLGNPKTAAVLTRTALALAVGGTLCSSVRVESDQGATGEIRVVEGTQSRPDSAALTRSSTLGLSRDRAVGVRLRPIWPFANRVWAYTSSHVSQRDRVALPWHPARWSYPKDFDEIVTLFVLPTTAADHALRSDSALRFVLRGIGGDTVIDAVLPEHGLRVQFFGQPADAQTLVPVWTEAYHEHLAPAGGRLASDSLLLLGLMALADTARRRGFLERHDAVAERLSVVPARVQAWVGATTLRGRRPLHLGERMRFHFQDERGAVRPLEMVLDRNPYVLLIDASHVSR